MKHLQVALGLDFGTEAVRALVVDLGGRELASAAIPYAHRQITHRLPGSQRALPAKFALQHPADWLESAAQAVIAARQQAGICADSVIGIGIDFTSCTVLPTTIDGTPLCVLEQFADEPMAWAKLWKHHGAQSQADRLNRIAHERKESFLARYGGTISLEWLFPKLLETLECAPQIYHAADLFLEAGDWVVWQLVGTPRTVPRSTCQAGYKALWSVADGYPSDEYFAAAHPDFSDVVSRKLSGDLLAPGTSAGGLAAGFAERLDLRTGTPVSAAIIDAHAGVPGAGAAEPGALVMVLGTSSCHMVNSRSERHVPGVAGVVRDGILPGFYGYETGQAAVGDAFAWLQQLTGTSRLSQLGDEALGLPAGADGVRCVDWFHGCRTPLMNDRLRGSFSGLRLHHRPAHLYRALLEATAMGVKWIADALRDGGVLVEQFIATGGLPHHHPELMQVYADVLGESIVVHPSRHGPALGAAVLGALAAGAFDSPQAAIEAMSAPPLKAASVYEPNQQLDGVYDAVYADYRRACQFEADSQSREL